MQQNELSDNECLKGVISKSDNSFRFEEAVKKLSPRRNPKIYSGNYCSLVHMQNGKYQIHMKTINASAVTDPLDLAFKVYSEIINALKVIN